MTLHLSIREVATIHWLTDTSVKSGGWRAVARDVIRCLGSDYKSLPRESRRELLRQVYLRRRRNLTMYSFIRE